MKGLRLKCREFVRSHKKSDAFYIALSSSDTGLADYQVTLLWFEKNVKQTVTGVSLIYGLRADPVDMTIHWIIAKGPQIDGMNVAALIRNSVCAVFQSYRFIGAGNTVIELTDEYVNEDLSDDLENDITAPGESLNVYVSSEIVTSYRLIGNLEILEKWTQRIFPDILSEHEQDMFAEEDFELLQHNGSDQ